MPIEFPCSKCGQKLSVPETAAGKKAQCPVCSTISPVPARSQAMPSQSMPSQAMPSQGASPTPSQGAGPLPMSGPPSGPQPIPQPNPQTKPLQGPAHGFGDVPGTAPNYSGAAYPTSSPYSPQPTNPYGTSTSANPYASPSYVPDAMPGNFTVTYSDIWDHAYAAYSRNMGLMIGACIIVTGINLFVQFGGNQLLMMMRGAPGGPILAAAIAMTLVNNMVQIFLGIGTTRLMLKVARNQGGEIGDLFSGGDMFVSMLGYLILMYLASMVGVLLVVVGFIVLWIYCWSGYYYVLEGKAGIIDAFGTAAGVNGRYVGTIILLWLTSVALIFVGAIACGIGVLATLPLVQLIWATTYLMFSGQLVPRRLAAPQYPMAYPQQFGPTSYGSPPGYPQQPGYNPPSNYPPPPGPGSFPGK